MEQTEVKKSTKLTGKKSNSATIRVSVDTRKRLVSELLKINKKQYGKRVKIDALLMLLLTKITSQDVTQLQEASLTGRDRIEQSYKAHCAKFGQITRDEYFALLLRPKVTNEINKIGESSDEKI
jgi:hypothetical protein